MAEYIEREAAMNACKEAQIMGLPQWNSGLEDALERIKNLPAADVVGVVRCRDCKYRAEDDFCTGRGWPDQLVADNGFCDKGKRKDGGQDDE